MKPGFIVSQPGLWIRVKPWFLPSMSQRVMVYGANQDVNSAQEEEIRGGRKGCTEAWGISSHVHDQDQANHSLFNTLNWSIVQGGLYVFWNSTEEQKNWTKLWCLGYYASWESFLLLFSHCCVWLFPIPWTTILAIFKEHIYSPLQAMFKCV